MIFLRQICHFKVMLKYLLLLLVGKSQVLSIFVSLLPVFTVGKKIPNFSSSFPHPCSYPLKNPDPSLVKGLVNF